MEWPVTLAASRVGGVTQIFHSKLQITKHHIFTFSFINKTNLKSTIIQNYYLINE